MICRYCILALWLLSSATPVRGQEDVWHFGQNFKGWEIASLRLTGVPGGYASDLRKGLALAGDDAVLYEQVIGEDIDRIALYLARRGYPYATVELDGQPSPEGRKLHLTVKIDAGPAVRVRNVDVAGIPSGVNARIFRTPPFGSGEVFVESRMAGYRNALLEALNKDGYARARVESKLSWPDTVTVDLLYDVDAGAVYHFRQIDVEGAPDDLTGLVHTMVDIHPGDRFDPRLMEDARNYLSKLGLFRQIRLDTTTVQPDSLDLNVFLDQRLPRSLEVAAGYWSDEQLSGRLAWRHRNLLRGGRGVSVELVGTQFRQYAEAMLWWPAIFGKKRSMWTLRFGINNENEESYEKTAPGIGSTISYLFTRRVGGTLGYFIERASYDIKSTEQPLFPETAGIVGWWDLRVTRDGTDDRVNPERGVFSWIRMQYGPSGGMSSSRWILGELSGTLHVPLRRRLVVAVNARAGAGEPIAPSAVLLPDKRFYAGGSVSHRGFARRDLGPKDENGVPLGGEIMATGFVEFRFPFVWKFEGALFTDWGQVWRTDADVNVRNVEIAVGPALRLATPVGPFRLDFGWRVTDHDTEAPRWAFHFAIGYPM